MINFKSIFILFYFKEYKDQYLLSEISRLCNLSIKQLNREISSLVEENFIEINNGIYFLTNKAFDLLKETNLLNLTFDELQKEIVSFKKQTTKLDFDDIYIPENFKL